MEFEWSESKRLKVLKDRGLDFLAATDVRREMGFVRTFTASGRRALAEHRRTSRANGCGSLVSARGKDSDYHNAEGERCGKKTIP